MEIFRQDPESLLYRVGQNKKGTTHSRNKTVMLNRARDCFNTEHWQKPEAVNWKTVATERMGFIPDQCPFCKEGILEIVEVMQPTRGPPVMRSVLSNTSWNAA